MPERFEWFDRPAIESFNPDVEDEPGRQIDQQRMALFVDLLQWKDTHALIVEGENNAKLR